MKNELVVASPRLCALALTLLNGLHLSGLRVLFDRPRVSAPRWQGGAEA